MLKCLVHCPTLFYEDSGSSSCVGCDSSCLNCSDGTSCNQCVERKYKSSANSLCDSNCVSGCRLCKNGSSC